MMLRADMVRGSAPPRHPPQRGHALHAARLPAGAGRVHPRGARGGPAPRQQQLQHAAGEARRGRARAAHGAGRGDPRARAPRCPPAAHRPRLRRAGPPPLLAPQPGGALRGYLEALRYPGSRLDALKHLAALPLVPFLPVRTELDWAPAPRPAGTSRRRACRELARGRPPGHRAAPGLFCCPNSRSDARTRRDDAGGGVRGCAPGRPPGDGAQLTCGVGSRRGMLCSDGLRHIIEERGCPWLPRPSLQRGKRRWLRSPALPDPPPGWFAGRRRCIQRKRWTKVGQAENLQNFASKPRAFRWTELIAGRGLDRFLQTEFQKVISPCFVK